MPLTSLPLARVSSATVTLHVTRFVPTSLGTRANNTDSTIDHMTRHVGRLLLSGLGVPVGEMENVSVAYEPRKTVKYTCKAPTVRVFLWSFSPSLLRIFAGSGKTTSLALLTGDYPKSYMQPLPSVSSKLHTNVWQRPSFRAVVVSPELLDAVPHRVLGMRVWDAVATGFGGGLFPQALGLDIADDVRAGRGRRVWELGWLIALPIGAQRMVPLMCVLVGRPPLLNEVWSGIDDSVDLAARAHLRAGRVGPEQAVVVATQLPDEAPAWGEKDSITE
ncbi:hypothetical protein B0H15DRAFT_944498 [Mycena belliarum]|uniref:Uncharacterized protein n=1 Tax=Mycena belliarum TaxID=1033014 RepID=A0AAD6UKU6_9AGAR|nr:hypothetical protein B0H15DRAFT_944498 [Mycena belliae]